MKPKLIIGCTLVAIASACSHLGQNELKSSSPRVEEIRKAMNQTVIPEVDLDHVNAEDALNVWSLDSRTYHPQHFKFQHIVSYPVSYSIQPTGQGSGRTVTATTSLTNAPKVTVRRKRVTSKRLLDEICRQANLTWTITGRVIVIKPRGSPPDGRS
jgi:hypothetical protein